MANGLKEALRIMIKGSSPPPCEVNVDSASISGISSMSTTLTFYVTFLSPGAQDTANTVFAELSTVQGSSDSVISFVDIILQNSGLVESHALGSTSVTLESIVGGNSGSSPTSWDSLSIGAVVGLSFGAFTLFTGCLWLIFRCAHEGRVKESVGGYRAERGGKDKGVAAAQSNTVEEIASQKKPVEGEKKFSQDNPLHCDIGSCNNDVSGSTKRASPLEDSLFSLTFGVNPFLHGRFDDMGAFHNEGLAGEETAAAKRREDMELVIEQANAEATGRWGNGKMGLPPGWTWGKDFKGGLYFVDQSGKVTMDDPRNHFETFRVEFVAHALRKMREGVQKLDS